MPTFEAILAKYGWVCVGLTFGFAAKYALLLKKGVPLRLRLVVADLLLLPMVGLIAFIGAGKIGAAAEVAAVFACFCAVGADRLVKLLTERFLQKVDAEVRGLAEETMGIARQAAQTERSAHAVISDTITGSAPDEYAALKPHPQAPKGG